MARLAPTVLVLALLGGTAAAFAYTERLKLQPTAITDTRVPYRAFSPVCRCERAVSPISFDLREAARLRFDLIGPDDRVVRTLVRGERRPAGQVTLVWDGRDDAGALLPDGVYRPRVDLGNGAQVIDIPTPIRIDTVSPRITLTRAWPLAISPDNDGRFSYVKLEYRVSERARSRIVVNGRILEGVSKYGRLRDARNWFGKVRGRPLAAGTYRLQLGAIDTAGNEAPRTPPIAVTIRYTALARDRVVTAVGRRFRVRVVSDARTFRWSFAGRTGAARPGPLVLRAPNRPGRYPLRVHVNGRGETGAVVVHPRR